MVKYSVIVPVFNEQDSVAELHSQVKTAMDILGEPYEIIFINDGSSDKTLENLKNLTPVVAIDLRKNFGQTAALDAGFKQASGEIFITMDGDLQNDPKDIPNLLNKLAEGYDVVSGWRHKRHDSLIKKFLSRGANFLRKFLVNDEIHDSGCTLKVYRRECFQDLTLFGEMHRFIPAVLKLSGFKIGEIKVEHHSRHFGKTKYTWKRVLKGFLDMLSVWFWRKYSSRPLHLFGGLGFLLTFSGGVLGLYLLISRVFYGISLKDRITPLLAVLLVILGVQFFISGILADIAIKTYYNNHDRKNYSVREIIVNKENNGN